MRDLFEIRTKRVRITWREPSPPGFVAWHEPGRARSPGRVVVEGLADSSPEIVRLDGTPRDGDTGPELFENLDYDVAVEALEPTCGIDVRHADPVMTARLRSFAGGRVIAGVVNFRSEVGTSRFVIHADGQPEVAFTVEVFPSKLDYREDVSSILDELETEAPGFVLSWLQSTRREAREADNPSASQVNWLEQVAFWLSELEAGLAEVSRHPHRTIDSNLEMARADRLRRVDSTVRRAVARGSGTGPFIEVGAIIARSVLPYRPARMTLDTPEHRWLAREVDGIRKRLTLVLAAERGVSGRPGQNSVRTTRRVADLERLVSRVERLGRLEPLMVAKGQPPPGLVSLRLLQGTGYADAWQACRHLALALSLEEGLRELSTQSLDRLYEVWVWVRVVRSVEHALGGRVVGGAILPLVQRGMHLRVEGGRAHEVRITAPDGRTATLQYNRHFDDPNQVLVGQWPDILVSVEANGWPAQRLVIDAKYRIDASAAHQSKLGAPAPPDDALNVLYRYRDAILEKNTSIAGGPPLRTVVEAAAVYPYRPPEMSGFEAARVWTSLARIGVGAIPLVPGEGGTRWLHSWLARTVAVGPWQLADKVRPHRSLLGATELRRGGSERVLVGVVPDRSDERMAWHRNERRYYLPLQSALASLLDDSAWVALFFRRSGHPRGDVAWFARVRDCRIVQREDILTPWPPAHASGQPCILYELDEFRAIGPIHDTAPAVVQLRWGMWTNLLALRQARCIEELGLETEIEWRLLSLLRGSGRSCQVRLDEPTSPGSPWASRAALASEDWVVRALDRERFSVRYGGDRPEIIEGVEAVLARLQPSSQPSPRP